MGMSPRVLKLYALCFNLAHAALTQNLLKSLKTESSLRPQIYIYIYIYAIHHRLNALQSETTTKMTLRWSTIHTYLLINFFMNLCNTN